MVTEGRYKWLNDSRVILCSDCSTSTYGEVVQIPQVPTHERWHRIQDLALVLAARGPDEYPHGYYVYLARRQIEDEEEGS